MRDPKLVPVDQRDRWLVGAALAARFLHQLSFQIPSTYYTRTPSEALGGMRIALWDNRQPLSASAAALLATMELRIALDELSTK